MTLDDIKKLLHGTQSFTIRMVSGRTITVPHPDFVALTRSNSSLLLSGENSLVEIVRLSQIENIVMHEGAANA
jgi:hypothetical protein